MKKIFVLASLFVAAAMISCEKNDGLSTEKAEGIKVLATTPVDTRAIVEPNGNGNYTVKWDTAPDTEHVRIFYAYGGTNPIGNWGNDPKVAINVAEDGTNGTFVLAADKKPGVTQVWVIYPADASNNNKLATPYHANNKLIYVQVSDTQTCGENAPDPTQTIMFASLDYPGAGTARADFHHIMSYGKLNFTGLDALEGENITSVTFTANDADALAASIYNYNIETGEWSEYDATANDSNPSKSITVTPQSGIAKGGEHNIWFAAIPSTVAYKDITVDVTLDGTNTYTKTFTVDNGVKFNVGKVRPINVDMSGATTK